MTDPIADRLVQIAARLRDEVEAMRFGPPVACTYNPLAYAWPCHEAYLRRFGGGAGRIVLLGMNPGPFGMVQTGVPFGEVAAVRDWMGICERVRRPPCEHPKRPVLGFDSHRSEVSGRRLWGWARDRFGSPESFFARFLVLNYCPAAFVEDSGRNRTPDKLPANERRPLFGACDRALLDSIEALRPRRLVGIGRFAEKCLQRVVGDRVPIGRILHPSPASPLANHGWEEAIERELREMGVDVQVSC